MTQIMARSVAQPVAKPVAQTVAQTVAKGELQREAARVLLRLAQKGAVLAPVKGDFGVFVRRNKYGRPVIRTETRLVRAFVSADWLAETQPPQGTAFAAPVYTLSEVGAAHLRRAGSGEATGDGAFAAQHRVAGRQAIADEAGVRTHAVNAAESPLAWLATRKGPGGAPLLGRAEVEAGERLRRDFTLAGLTPKVTMDWSLAPGTAPKGGGGEAGLIAVHDAALAARQRLAMALGAAGPDLQDILLRVCCHLEGLEAAEKGLGWPRRAGKLVLQIALKRLAAHYRLG